ncbi:hypothetical protein [Streptomyces prunicolor]|uniref:hypothetical protein n=1 Tax=Streptomyces prunicolor TaxID=67348 RepID=UPI0034318303
MNQLNRVTGDVAASAVATAVTTTSAAPLPNTVMASSAATMLTTATMLNTATATPS